MSITHTHHLYSWGANSHGQLGHGDIEAEELLVPREVDLSSSDMILEEVTKIVGGAGHTLVLDRLGRVYTCGWNDKGQSGLLSNSSRFERLKSLELETIVDVICGWNSSMALTIDGLLFVWGSNSHGQLGLTGLTKVDVPTKLALNEPVEKISMGLRHTAVVTKEGKLFVSGASTKGQLGVELAGTKCSKTFIQVPGLPKIRDVACGQHHTVALALNNELFAWGDNKHGQLGIDPEQHKIVPSPIKVEIREKIDIGSRIYCGWTHTCIKNSDNSIFSWGRNSYGQLSRAKETPVSELWKANSPRTSKVIRQLSVGSEHNVALCDDGMVLSWGWNEHGNCGNGDTQDIFEATEVKLPRHDAVLVGTGAGHSFAILRTNC